LEKSNVLEMKLNPRRALEVVREIAKDSGRVVMLPHARKRMSERKISLTQILRCLEKGAVVEGPARSANGNWELKLEDCYAGEVIQVVLALDNDKAGNKILVITVITL